MHENSAFSTLGKRDKAKLRDQRTYAPRLCFYVIIGTGPRRVYNVTLY